MKSLTLTGTALTTVTLLLFASSSVHAQDARSHTEIIESVAPDVASALNSSAESASADADGDIYAEVHSNEGSEEGLSAASFSMTYLSSEELEEVVEERNGSRFSLYEGGTALTALRHEDGSQSLPHGRKIQAETMWKHISLLVEMK